MASEPIQAISVKLNGSNYSYWSYLMRNFLIGRELWKYVNGIVVRPHVHDKNFVKLQSEWETCNAKILTWINNAVEPSIGMHLAKFESAKEAWDYLAGLYVQSNFAKKYQLAFDIRSTRQGDRSIHELYSVMTGLWDQLAMMEPLDLGSLDSYKKYREEQRLVQFLMALRDEFEPLCGSMLHRSPPPTVTDAVSELIAEETRLKSPILSSRASSSSTPLNTKPNRRIDKDECAYCHKTGHWKSHCPLLMMNDQKMSTGTLNGTTGPHRVTQQSQKYPQQNSSFSKPAAAVSTVSSNHDQSTASGGVTPELIQSMITQQFQQLFSSSVTSSPTTANAMSVSNVGVSRSSTSGSIFQEVDWDRA